MSALPGVCSGLQAPLGATGKSEVWVLSEGGGSAPLRPPGGGLVQRKGTCRLRVLGVGGCGLGILCGTWGGVGCLILPVIMAACGKVRYSYTERL